VLIAESAVAGLLGRADTLKKCEVAPGFFPRPFARPFGLHFSIDFAPHLDPRGVVAVEIPKAQGEHYGSKSEGRRRAA